MPWPPPHHVGNIVPGVLALFLAEVVFLAAFGLDGPTRGFRALLWAFVVAFGSWVVPVAAWAVCSSVVSVVIVNSPCAVITAVVTWIALVRRRSKRILLDSAKAMEWRWPLKRPDDYR